MRRSPNVLYVGDVVRLRSGWTGRVDRLEPRAVVLRDCRMRCGVAWAAAVAVPYEEVAE